MVNCPYCGKLTDPKLDGCPHCGGYLKKKRLAPAKQPKSSQTCPSCKAMVQRGDIICVVCGTNLLTGQKVADAGSGGGGGSSGVSIGIIVTGVIAAAAIVVIALTAFVSTSDPIDRARTLINDLQFLEAEDLLQAYVKDNPDDDEAWFELAKLHWRLQQYGEAANAFQTVVDINPSNDDAGLMGVLSMKLSSETVSAEQEISLLRKVAANSPDSAEIWYLLALALAVDGNNANVPEQIEALERVLSIAPGSDFARLDLAISQALNGSTDEARGTLRQITNDGIAGNVQATVGIVNTYDNLADAAIGNFQEALATETLSTRWQVQTALAQLLIQEGRFKEAEERLQTALGQNPDNDQGRYLRGLALHALNRANESLAEYESVMRGQNEFSGRAAVQAANIQLLLGDVDAAERSLTIARRENVETPAYHTVRGRVQVGLSDNAGALQSFNTALQMDPTYASAYLERGLLYVKQNRVEDGVRDLNQYLELLEGNTIGTRANEIRLLTNQLQRALTEGRG